LKCRHCKREFTKHSSTTSLRYHVTRVHSLRHDDYEAGSFNQTSKNAKSGPSILTLLKAEHVSPKLCLAKLVVLDRIPFRVLAQSTEIQKGWIARGLKIPATEKGMKEMVMSFGEEIRSEIKKELKLEKGIGRKFSLSLDEWTSCGNKRYLCLNVHTVNKVYGVGMIRINGSVKAAGIIQIILEKLEQFELDMKTDIVALVTDSAFVMRKIGRLLGIEHQLCYNNGIHLAVVDVIYCVSNCASVESFNSSDDENCEDDDFDEYLENAPDIKNEFDAEVGNVVKKVRKIVASFRRSPVKNDCLQKMCEDMLGKNLALIMDSRVRWNSMLTNMRRFLEMKDCVKSALKSLSDVDNFLYETELTLISDIVNALEPVAVCVNALGRKDCSLATAETVLEFLLRNLKEQRSDIAKKLFNAMKNRIEERRNASLCGLLCYLDNPSSYVSSSSSNCILTRPNKRDIKATAKDLFDRMFKIQVEETKDIDDSDSEKSDPDISKSIADQLDTLIRRRKYSKCDLMDSCHGKDIMKIIKNEMAVFEAVGQRPKTLQKLYDALITAPPTSCETGRSFSAAGLFVTKLRLSLKDETIDTLCLLLKPIPGRENERIAVFFLCLTSLEASYLRIVNTMASAAKARSKKLAINKGLLNRLLAELEELCVGSADIYEIEEQVSMTEEMYRASHVLKAELEMDLKGEERQSAIDDWARCHQRYRYGRS
ncbi:hypothetical protein T01_9761, partial [Trichinella spiralis]